MKIGFLQFSPAFCNVEKTMDKILYHKRAISEADLLVLPELCNSGYNFADKEEALSASEEVNNSIFLKFLTDLCHETQTSFVTGFNEREGQKLYNSAIYITDKGICGKYRKLHLFMNEKDIFDPGNLGLPVFDFRGFKLGMLVCFDWMFPEIWRILALKNAHIICHPSNLVLPFAQQAVPVYALTNRIYIVTANRIGSEKNLTFTGISIISSPKGKILDKATEKDEVINIVDVDLKLSEDKMITPRNHAFFDRRPDEYKFIL